jgi:hypothetical protein
MGLLNAVFNFSLWGLGVYMPVFRIGPAGEIFMYISTDGRAWRNPFQAWLQVRVFTVVCG